MRGTSVIGVILGLFLLAIALLIPFSSALASDPVSVTIRPTFLNTFQCRTVTGKIYIKTDVPATYTISIAGVPAEWVEYPPSVYVDSAKTVNYMINPKKRGDYRLAIKVAGSGETFNFTERLWVGRNQVHGAEFDSGAGPAETGNGLTGGLTGMFVLSDLDRPVLLSTGVVIAFLITVLVGYAFLKETGEADIWA